MISTILSNSTYLLLFKICLIQISQRLFVDYLDLSGGCPKIAFTRKKLRV